MGFGLGVGWEGEAVENPFCQISTPAVLSLSFHLGTLDCCISVYSSPCLEEKGVI